MDTENTVNEENADSTYSTEDIVNIHKKKNPRIRWSIVVAIFLGLTLPFHYIPGRMMIFPKDSLSFSYTIITQEDIDDVIEKYNDAENIWEQMKIAQSPLARKLLEKGIITVNNKKRNY